MSRSRRGGDGDRRPVGTPDNGPEITRRRFCVGRLEKLADHSRIRMIQCGNHRTVRRCDSDLNALGHDFIDEPFRINQDTVSPALKSEHVGCGGDRCRHVQDDFDAIACGKSRCTGCYPHSRHAPTCAFQQAVVKIADFGDGAGFYSYALEIVHVFLGTWLISQHLCLHEGLRHATERRVGALNGICGKQRKLDLFPMGCHDRGCINCRQGRGDDRENYAGKGGDKPVMALQL